MRRSPLLLLLILVLALALIPTGAGAQTLPSVPQLEPGQAWASLLQGGMTLTTGEVNGRTITSSGAIVVGGGRVTGNLRGFMMFTKSEHGSSGTEVQSERYAIETSLQAPFWRSLYLTVNGDWERDPTHGFEHRILGSAGVGSHVPLNSTFRLDLEGSGGLVREGVTVGDTEEYAALAALARTHWTMTETLSLATELEIIANAGDSGDRRLHADIGLTTALWGPAHLSISYLFSHDTDPPLVIDPFNIQQPAAAAAGSVGALTVRVGVAF